MSATTHVRHRGRACAIAATARLVLPAALAMIAGCGALPSYEEVRSSVPADELVEIDGQWVHYERAGAGTPVILLHGFGESTYSWRHVLPVLAESFDVVAIDLNGFGLTERPFGVEPYLVDGQVDLVLALMDELGLSDAHLVAHSYGTSVATRLAERQPQHVRTLVLIAGVPGVNDVAGMAIPLLVRTFLPCYVKQFLLTPEQVRTALESVSFIDDYITDEVVDAYLERLRIEGLERAIDGLIAQIEAGPVAIDLAALAQPALVIWGRHDPLYPVELGETLTAALPDAAFIVVEDSGHVVMEEQPAALLETIIPFLAAH